MTARFLYASRIETNGNRFGNQRGTNAVLYLHKGADGDAWSLLQVVTPTRIPSRSGRQQQRAGPSRCRAFKITPGGVALL